MHFKETHPVKTDFIPKKKCPAGYMRLDKLEHAIICMYLNYKMNK